jgi:hypothetical protein
MNNWEGIKIIILLFVNDGFRKKSPGYAELNSSFLIFNLPAGQAGS